MHKKGANISLKGYDDIFSTDQARAEAQQERVQETTKAVESTVYTLSLIHILGSD